MLTLSREAPQPMVSATAPPPPLQEIVEQHRSGQAILRLSESAADGWRVYFSSSKFHFATPTVGQKARLAYLLKVKQGADFDPNRWAEAPSDYSYLLSFWRSGQISAHQLRQAIALCLQEALVHCAIATPAAIEHDRHLDLDPLLVSAPLDNILAPVRGQIEGWAQMRSQIPCPLQRVRVQNLDKFYWSELPKSKHPDFVRQMGRLLVKNLSLYEIATALSVDTLQLARGLQPLVRSQIVTTSPFEAAPTRIQAAPPSGPLVACIDDSRAVRQQVTGILEASGYRVLSIGEPARALSQIARDRPELILLDITMPEIDGYELCRLLNQSILLSEVPIVMVTGRNGTIDRLRARLVGARDYITKPFEAQKLVTLVEKLTSPANP